MFIWLIGHYCLKGAAPHYFSLTKHLLQPQCQKKDEHNISVGAYVTSLILLIAFIYLFSINNLLSNTQWYANEQFNFNEVLMTKQRISTQCGEQVICKRMNFRALFNV